MKTNRYLVTAAALCLAVVAAFSTAVFSQSGREAAETLMTQYFQALQEGDTARLKSLLAGDLLDSRARLLSNPQYADQLRRLYSGAQFSVTRVEPHDHPGYWRIDTQIKLAAGDVLRARFVAGAPSAGEPLRLYEEQPLFE